MSNTIPVPNKIDVPEIPTITYVELVRQVFDNINSQIYLLEGEIGKASQGGGENIKALYTHVNALKTHAEQASQIIGTVSEDPQQLQTAGIFYHVFHLLSQSINRVFTVYIYFVNYICTHKKSPNLKVQAKHYTRWKNLSRQLMN